MLLLLFLVGACTDDDGAADAEPQRVAVTLRFADTTTTELSLPATAGPCHGGGAVLVEAASERGNGLLVLLRYGDSLTPGLYPVLVAGDTTAPRGAEVAVRYVLRDVPHGFALDSGTVTLTAAGPTLTGSAQGRGLEESLRIGFVATLSGVPLGGDSVPCGRER